MYYYCKKCSNGKDFVKMEFSVIKSENLYICPSCRDSYNATTEYMELKSQTYNSNDFDNVDVSLVEMEILIRDGHGNSYRINKKLPVIDDAYLPEIIIIDGKYYKNFSTYIDDNTCCYDNITGIWNVFKVR